MFPASKKHQDDEKGNGQARPFGILEQGMASKPQDWLPMSHIEMKFAGPVAFQIEKARISRQTAKTENKVTTKAENQLLAKRETAKLTKLKIQNIHKR